MGLIKSSNAPARIQPFSMKDIEEQARGILLRARQQAEQLIAAAQEEAERLRITARKSGFEDGRAQGNAQGRSEGLKAGRETAIENNRTQLTALIGTLTNLITEIEQSRRELEAAAVRDVLCLAIAIAERVTKRQGALDPSVAVQNAMEAMKLTLHASDVRIAIHPSQLTALTEALPALKAQLPVTSHLQLIEDASLLPGGCRVFTAQGMIDGNLDEQIARVVADLLPDRKEGCRESIS